MKDRRIRCERANPCPGPRIGTRQRINQAIADEIPVVDLLAKIATVGKSTTPVRKSAPQCMVTPLPHEASSVARVAHLLGISSSPTRPSSHRVEILAHDVGSAANTFLRSIIHSCARMTWDSNRSMQIRVIKHRGDFFECRIHSRVDIDVLHGVVTFVVDDPSPIGAFMEPMRRCRQVATCSRFVPQAPAENAGMILVAFKGTFGAVEVGGFPPRIIGGVINPRAITLKTVGFNIPLEHDPQANFIGQIKKVRMRRVMGCSDRVNTHRLHEFKIGARKFFAEYSPFVGANFMAIDTIKRQGLPIGMQNTINDFDPSEAEAQVALFRKAATLPHCLHARSVEFRRLRTPRLDSSEADAFASIAAILPACERQR